MLGGTERLSLIGGGLMVNVYGLILDGTGDHALALLPIAAVSIVGAVLILAISRPRSQLTLHSAAVERA